LLLLVAFLTDRLIGRVLTSELPFVVIWSTAELRAVRVAFSNGWLTRRGAAVAVGVVSTGLAVGLACYATYFLFYGKARFYCGLVPYGAVSLAMATVGALLWNGRGMTNSQVCAWRVRCGEPA
jgi:hypothetical protein